MLSREAAEFAAEINNHDWSDAHTRADKAGHQRHMDGANAHVQLPPEQVATIHLNVMWVVAQVLKHKDPNLDVHEFAAACGVDTGTPSGRPNSGAITSGLRRVQDGDEWVVAAPGGTEPGRDPEPADGLGDARGKLNRFVVFARQRGWTADPVEEHGSKTSVSLRNAAGSTLYLPFHNNNYIAVESRFVGNGHDRQMRNLSQARRFVCGEHA